MEWVGLGDVMLVNRYYGWYTHTGDIAGAVKLLGMELDALHNRFNKPVVITESGADTYLNMHSDESDMFTEEFQTNIIKTYLDIAASKDYVSEMHVWALSDFKTGQGIIRFGGMNYKSDRNRGRPPKRVFSCVIASPKRQLTIYGRAGPKAYSLGKTVAHRFYGFDTSRFVVILFSIHTDGLRKTDAHWLVTLYPYSFIRMHTPSEKGYIDQVSIHCVIFGYQNNQLKVLIPKLIYKGDFWALPSGFVYQDEDTDEAAKRILEDRTGIKDVYLESFKTMGKASRNSRNFMKRLNELNPNSLDDQTRRRESEWFARRFIGIGYYALVDLNKVVAQKNEIDESIEWFAINSIPQMIMDHNQLVDEALDTLRVDLDRKQLAFHLLPETFTMKEVQELYETILEKSFAANNFPKRILELNALERLEKKFTGAANKAPYLYRFPKQNRAHRDAQVI